MWGKGGEGRKGEEKRGEEAPERTSAVSILEEMLAGTAEPPQLSLGF